MSKPKLLWIKSDSLHPLNTGGKIRTYNMLVELKQHYEITFFSLKANNSTIQENEIAEYCDKQVWVDWYDSKSNKVSFVLELLKNFLFSTLPFVIYRYTRLNISAALQKQLSTENYDVVICDFLSLSKNLTLLPKNTNAPYIIFQHNVESKIWERLAINAGNPLSKFYFTNQWKRYLRYEQEACQWFDGVIAVSAEDAEIFRNEFALNNVLGDVPTGVDLSFFSKLEWSPEKNSLVFLGSMDWMPNIDGIIDFIENTYPLIKASIADVKLTIVGRNPGEKILAFGKKDPSIEVTGTVDDIRPYLASAAIAIVPLRVGGGTRIKIFETMAAHLPVVSTSIGAEGLPIEHDTNICIADSSVDFAKNVIALLEDPERANSIAASGQTLVKEQFSWKTVTEDFMKMLNNVTSEK